MYMVIRSAITAIDYQTANLIKSSPSQFKLKRFEILNERVHFDSPYVVQSYNDE